MDEVKHTPIPWELGPVLRECDGHEATNYFTEQREIYPHLAGPGEEQHGGPLAVVSIGECGEANAALFMAAPYLLAACKARLAADDHFRTCRMCGADLNGNVWYCGVRNQLADHAALLMHESIAKTKGQP